MVLVNLHETDRTPPKQPQIPNSLGWRDSTETNGSVYFVALPKMEHGTTESFGPGRMVKEGESVKLKMRIPNRWDYALDKLGRSKVLPDYLGKEFVKCYVDHRRVESQQFQNQVSPLDFDWYLRSV